MARNDAGLVICEACYYKCFAICENLLCQVLLNLRRLSVRRPSKSAKASKYQSYFAAWNISKPELNSSGLKKERVATRLNPGHKAPPFL
jgi:hypothetical protein